MFLKIGEVRSLIPAGVNIMALTATATVKLRKEVAKIISMRNELVVLISPARPNIVYAVAQFHSIQETFSPLVMAVLQKAILMPKIIIYCRSKDDCTTLYLHFKNSLCENFVYPNDAPDLPQFRIPDYTCASEHKK